MNASINMDSFQSKIAALRERYAEQTSEKIDFIVSTWSRYCETPNRDDFEVLLMEVHRISGTAKTYGFPRLGEMACDLEKLLIDEGVANPSAKALSIIDQLKDYSADEDEGFEA